MCHRSKSAHLGSSLSCVDILVSAFWCYLKVDTHSHESLDRDHLILSKGHAAMALYATLAKRNILSAQEIETYNSDGGRLAEHPPANCIPYVDVATGSLGHGLPIGSGLAMAKMIKNIKSKTLVILSDGENNEGSTWEAAMFASGKKLNGLTVVVDANGWQATDRTNDVLDISNLCAKWTSFGWKTVEVDGHDILAITSALQQTKRHGTCPTAVIANTVKGKGVSFMEDDNNWHYRVPNTEELEASGKELGII